MSELNKLNQYNEPTGCELVNDIYNTNYQFQDVFGSKSVYPYPNLIITNDKLKQQNADIYQKYMDHGLLQVNNDPSCVVDFNVRNLNNAGNLQRGYARNIDLDSELKRINHIRDRCYYDNYKYHPMEAVKGNGLYCHRNTLVNDYTAVGKPEQCAVPLDGQQYKSVLLPGHLQNDYQRGYEKKMSSNEVSQGYHTTGDYPPTERLNYQGCVNKKPEVHKPQVRPFKQWQKTDNATLDEASRKLLDYKKCIAGNSVDHYNFNGSVNNQDARLTRQYPNQRLFNNNTKRSTLRNFHNLYDINPKYLS